VEEFPGTVWSFTIIPEHAWDPTPTDGDQRVNPDPNVVLSWQLGAVQIDSQTLSYNVYYGSVLADVEAETSGMVTVTDPTAEIGPLAADTTYYWKVNTVLTLTRPPFTETVITGEIWQFKTLPVVPIVEEDLIGWWKLDGDIVPGLAFDSSGYANHGTLMGDPQFVPGKVDNAIELDGNGDYVDCGNAAIFNDINDTITVAAWIQVDTFDVGWQAIVTKGDNSWRLHRWGGNNSLSWNCNGVTGGSLRARSDNIGIDDGEWYHLAALYDGVEIALYINGELDNFQEASGSIATNSYPVMIGENAQQAGRHWFGLIDDARLYKRALSSKEIQILAGRLGASSPDPANGATDVPRTPTLSWLPGVFVGSTNGNVLYYGEDAAAVSARTATSVTLTDATYTLPLTLDLGQTFYWAVDTVNGLEKWPGDVWSFEVTNWLEVDNMETYTPWTMPGNNIFEAYRDGMGNCTAGNGNDTGANLTENMDTAFVRNGVQSMMYDYDNDGMVYNPCTMAQGPRSHLYSKIEAQVAGLPSGIGTNWTIQGVKALSLRFYGQATNDIEPMWVQLNGGAKVTYGDYDDEDPADITEEEWHEWFIDLADFGVTLNNVTTFAIGIGTEGSATPGGAGKVYFDDFRLYTPVCMPSRHSAAMAKLDFAPVGAPDCVIGYEELDIMADNWLDSDDEIATTTPSAPVAHWKFKGSLTDEVTAIAGTPYGTSGGPTYVGGYDGDALNFSAASSDHVTIPDITGRTEFNTESFSVGIWIKSTSMTGKEFILCNGSNGTEWTDASGKRYVIKLENDTELRCLVDDDNRGGPPT
ncbi:MAG: LamG domain-containing protein, partial [Planctomycetota bacterium]